MINKKMKTTLVGALALTLALSGSALQVAAADRETTVPVSYSNTKDIPDPENPDNPDWVVRVPSSIEFTETRREVDASVELIEKTATGLQTGKTVTVSVKSNNSYKLMNDDQSASYDYTLSYTNTNSGNPLSGGDYAVIGTFTSIDKVKKEGRAKFDKNVTKVGSYTDTLTYKVSTNPIP
ncbi:MAG: hypothetical protein ACI4DR_05615 [Roseburia sp.]